MKGFLLLLQKIRKNVSKFHIFDAVVILFLLNVVAFTLVTFYIKKINSLVLPVEKRNFLKITSVPLTQDLDSINASASAYVVFDVANRRVIAGKNQQIRFSPASTAKVMSATIILEHFKLEEYLTVPSSIYAVQGSKMNLVPGEQVTVKNLLYGLMLPSGNDAAYTFSYYYPGGVTGFVFDMNKKAELLKLQNTHFEDPAGYEDGNYTTAEELARLASYAMRSNVFAEIVKTRYIEVNNLTGSHKFFLKNLNELLEYDNVIGIKTGFTNEAGGVLLTAVQKDGKIFIVSVLKSPDRFSDTKDIMNFIQEKVDFSVPRELN